jgi:hypothetical protein
MNITKPTYTVDLLSDSYWAMDGSQRICRLAGLERAIEYVNQLNAACGSPLVPLDWKPETWTQRMARLGYSPV